MTVQTAPRPAARPPDGRAPASERPPIQRGVVAAAVAGLLAVSLAAFLARGGLDGDGARYALGALASGLAGIGLYHAAFGFTAAFRRLARERRGAGLRAQAVLIALVAVVSYPMIGAGAASGYVLPMSAASAIGALMFGIGMQFGGSCASGTLFTVGGGSTRTLVTLVAFIAGSVIATAHIGPFWRDFDRISGIPTIPPFSAISAFGTPGALAVLAAFLAGLWAVSAAIERRAHGTLDPGRRTESLLRGPWSLVLGAAVLALWSVVCLAIFGQPWGVTSAFALWGAKIAALIGFAPETWAYWQGWRAEQLSASVFADRTSLTNFGIVFGALGAAGLAGRFAPVLHLPWRLVLASVAGGLLMGYGARLAFGCNIGAYLGGLVSGSAHGLWWLAFGWMGSSLALRVRPRLGLG